MILIDLGQALQLPCIARKGGGTKGYRAPEVLQYGLLGQAADIWAAGATWFELVCEQKLLTSEHCCATALLWSNVEQRCSQIELFSRDTYAKDLLKCLLENDSHKRISATKALDHAYFTCQ